MKRYIGKIFAITFIALLFTVSCTDKFAEINTDPNRAKDAPATNVLAFVLRYHSSTFHDAWNDMNEPSTYGGHLAKIQYIDEASSSLFTSCTAYPSDFFSLEIPNAVTTTSSTPIA